VNSNRGKHAMTNSTIDKVSLAATIALLSVSSNAYADRKPRPPLPRLLGSKAAIIPAGEAEAQKAELSLKKAANSLKRNKEFLRLASDRDADGVRKMLIKTAGVDAPFAVTFANGAGGLAGKVKISWWCDGPRFLQGCHLHVDAA
jgi:hypothetical protein